MSDLPYTPPPPPPPMAPVELPPQFDFAKPFSYVFDDPQWLPKILIGGLFQLAGVLIIGWFFVAGYLARTMRNIVAGHERPLPEWEDLGSFFNEGLRLVGVLLVYILPLLFLTLCIMVPTAILGSIDNEGLDVLGRILSICLSCLFVPVTLAMLIFLPASLLFAAAEQSFGAAFQFGRIWPFIKQNVGNYLLAILIYLIARFIGDIGFFLLCIGVFFTVFWSGLITAHGFAQVYRLASKKG